MSPTTKNKVVDVLAENVETIMESKQETGGKLATKRGPTQKTINNIVRRRHKPTLRSLEKLAKALDTEVYQLLCPLPDKAFLIILRAYNATDARGRETLCDNAEILLRKASDRDQTGEAFDR